MNNNMGSRNANGDGVSHPQGGIFGANYGANVTRAVFAPKQNQAVQPIYKPTAAEAVLPPELGAEHYDDIDNAHKDNPLLTPEYAQMIMEYLRAHESGLSVSDWTARHPQLTGQMRALLVDWICRLHGFMKLCRESFTLSVQLLDRAMCATENMSRDSFKLYALTSLYLASKFEEQYTPAMSKFCHASGNTFTVAQISNCEIELLQLCQWDFSYATALQYQRRLSVAAGFSNRPRYFSFMVGEFAVQDYTIATTFTPSEIAAASVYLSRRLFFPQERPWTSTLEHYSGYTEQEITPCHRAIKSMLAHLDDQPQLKAIRSKYRSEANHRVADLLAQLTYHHPDAQKVD